MVVICNDGDLVSEFGNLNITYLHHFADWSEEREEAWEDRTKKCFDRQK